MINYDDTRHDITIETTPGPRTHSRLIIREPQITDSGNYTCSASNTEPASIYVFVSKGKCHVSIIIIALDSCQKVQTHQEFNMLSEWVATTTQALPLEN